MHKLFNQEAQEITRYFKANQIKAKVDYSKSIEVRTGYFRFALTMAPTERFANIERCIRELTSVLAAKRAANGYTGQFTIIPTSQPYMALETPHPAPTILAVSNRLLTEGEPHTMALGRSYLAAPREEIGDFRESPHWLVAGITGAGKSILMQNMLLSLTARTPPSELKLLLIDLKNEDFLPLRNLPHVLQFAGATEEAMDVLEYMDKEKLQRIADPNYKPYRIVLAIDELAQLAGNQRATEILGKLASIGRAKGLNLIGATQHPTKEGGMGPLLKANFTERLVGQVAPGQAQYATSRAKTHADLLPGKGSFLRCVGPNVYRFQSYFIDEHRAGQVSDVAQRIATMWEYEDTGRIAPIKLAGDRLPEYSYQISGISGIASYSQPSVSYSDTHTSEQTCVDVASDSEYNFFPLGSGRNLSEEEASALRALVANGKFHYRGKFSMNQAMEYVYGSRNPKRAAWIRQALG